jgi:hypothetical protein
MLSSQDSLCQIGRWPHCLFAKQASHLISLFWFLPLAEVRSNFTGSFSTMTDSVLGRNLNYILTFELIEF